MAPWAVDAAQYPVRATVIIDGKARVIYAAHTDLTTGSGTPRQLSEGILARPHQAQLLATGQMYDGEVLLRGGHADRGNAADVRGKRVLVVGIGPTGAWAAVAAVQQGAVRVDVASSTGGEKLPAPGEPGATVTPGMRPVEPQRRTHPDDQYASIENLDRVQDALRSYDDIKVATDRLVRVVPDGAGARATFLHGHGEGGEMYTVHYDVLVTALGSTNTTAEGRNAAGGGPTIKGVLGGMRMQAQRGTDAPVLEDAGTGRVRVIGIAAGENVNVGHGADDDVRKKEAAALKQRRDNIAEKELSADSPNADVMEGVGLAQGVTIQVMAQVITDTGLKALRTGPLSAQEIEDALVHATVQTVAFALAHGLLGKHVRLLRRVGGMPNALAEVHALQQRAETLAHHGGPAGLDMANALVADCRARLAADAARLAALAEMPAAELRALGHDPAVVAKLAGKPQAAGVSDAGASAAAGTRDPGDAAASASASVSVSRDAAGASAAESISSPESQLTVRAASTRLAVPKERANQRPVSVRSGVEEAPDVLLRGGQLSQRQEHLRRRLEAADDGCIQIGTREVTATDLAALTRSSGSEHAIVLLQDGTRRLIDLRSYKGGILPINTKRLLMHSHPDDGGSGMSKFISAEDVEAIVHLGQKYSYMVTVDGTVYRFSTNTLAYSIGEIVRTFHPMKGWVVP